MKKTSTILFLFGIIFLMAFSCKKDNVDNKNLQIKDYNCSDCKSSSNRFEVVEYLEYSTVEENFLSVKHINALFNCSPGKITASIKIEGSNLIITEDEESSIADCVCRYDINYKIGPLKYGQYQFILKKGENLTYLNFPITFNSSTNSSYTYEN